MKFTLEEVLKVNGHTPNSVPADIKKNLEDLIARVNKIGYPKPMVCSSGYRDPAYNKKIGGATKSAHCQGRAIDISDKDGKLKEYIMNQKGLLEKLGLRMESAKSAPTWCHLDTMPVKYSRVFLA